MSPDATAAIQRIRSIWDQSLQPSVRVALGAAAAVALFAAAHVSRVGTPGARLGAAAALLVGSAIVALAFLRRKRRDRSLEHVVNRTLGQTDPTLASATNRALRLVNSDQASSAELANLHLWKLLSRASTEAISDTATKRARRVAIAGAVLAASAVGLVAAAPLRLIEGFDIAFASDGVAPVPIPYLEHVSMVGSPPSYLKQDDESIFGFSAAALPVGSTVVVRGRPTVDGRTLVLTDGEQEVPFVEDGKGRVVARFTLTQDAELRVAARFGEVKVLQADIHQLTAIPDETPKVVLEGAPKQISLIDNPQITASYIATDDHGIDQVDLVLRAGSREERRVLSRNGANRKEEGGIDLRNRDPFLRDAFLPVEVTIQARDNDDVSGPKWGRSAEFTLMPPQIGEAEARRYVALLEARDALTDHLAERMRLDPPKGGDNKAHSNAERASYEKALKVVNARLDAEYGGLKIRGAVNKLVRGQIRRLDEAVTAEDKAPSAVTHKSLLATTEEVLLAVDAGLGMLGAGDARSVARKLADVADEIADAARVWGEGTDTPYAKRRMDIATPVLSAGGGHLMLIGSLGADLGEITQNGLRRIKRARADSDPRQTELAARDLAARLRQPDPSFGGGGGKGGGGQGGPGGVESGGTPGASEGDPSEADDQTQKDLAELERLIREQDSQLRDVEKALKESRSDDERKDFQEEAKKHAEAIREAVRGLPDRGGAPGSAENAGAAARQRAESMADALERGAAEEAVESGRGSITALQEAKKLAAQSDGIFDRAAGREAGAAIPTLADELAWAEQQLEQMQQRASERAKAQLEKSAEQQSKLGGETAQLQERGESGDSAMPMHTLDKLQEAAEAMREAAQALKSGDGVRGLDEQRRALRAMEQARQGQEPPSESEDGEGPNPRGAEGDGDKPMGDVPVSKDHEGPEAFRRRVTEGLGQASDPRFDEALKRYAEGLLQ